MEDEEAVTFLTLIHETNRAFFAPLRGSIMNTTVKEELEEQNKKSSFCLNCVLKTQFDRPTSAVR